MACGFIRGSHRAEAYSKATLSALAG
jgi:hypothetical protein